MRDSERTSARKVWVRLWHITRIWTNRLFTANINLANNRGMIREEVPAQFTDPRLRIGVSCSTLCRVIRKLRTRADYPKKVLSSLRLDGVDRRFTSDWDGVSRTNVERGEAEGAKGTRAEKPRKRRRGSGKASWEGEIGQEQASGRQIKRSDGGLRRSVGREKKIKEIEKIRERGRDAEARLREH